MTPAILLTRPAIDGLALARSLADQTGLDVVQSPLFRIVYADALPDFAGHAGVIFTSRNGVRAYAALNGPDLPAICVGDATAALARDIGLTARAMGGDSDALVRGVITNPPAGRLIHLHGEITRGNIAARLTDAGIPTGSAVLYRQSPQPLSSEATALLAKSDPVVLPFYSPATARQFVLQFSGVAPLYAVAISPNVARELATLDLVHLENADRPDADAMLDALGRSLATLRRVEGPGRGA